MDEDGSTGSWPGFDGEEEEEEGIGEVDLDDLSVEDGSRSAAPNSYQFFDMSISPNKSNSGSKSSCGFYNSPKRPRTPKQ